MIPLLIAGLLSTAFVGLYAYATYDAISVAAECFGRQCSKETIDMANVSFILNTIGGLISGTVVGVLALTKPNELPAAHLFRDGTSNTAKTIAAYIPVSFILVWIACGVAMVIWGFLKYPDAVPTLSAQAKGWLGSAAAALLAYITPPRRR